MKGTHIRIMAAMLAVVSLVLFGGFPTALAATTADGSTGEPKAEEQSKEVQAVEEDVQERVETAANDRRQQIIAEAAAAITETRNALQALEQEKPDEALAALERTTGKLELLLARDPELSLAPTAVGVVTYDLYANPDTIRQSIALAEEHLEDGNVQEARRLLDLLASEVVYSVTSIPLATYPDAIKKAVPLIDDGSIDAAKSVLQRALNTLVVTDYVSPLPLMRAEELLARAEELTEKRDRTEQESEELTRVVEAVRDQMEIAKLLGYGNEEDFETFETQLRAIEVKTESGGSGKGWFDAIKQTISDLF